MYVLIDLFRLRGMAETLKKETRGRPAINENTRLTGKQIKFVELVATKGDMETLQNLAIEAGFAKSGAHTRAYEMLSPKKSPHIVRALKERRAELNEKYGVTLGQHLADLGRIRDRSLSENNFGAAVQAEKARGMAAGLYVSKSEIRHGSIDQMSKEEVEKALNDLKKQLGERVIEHQSERVELLETTEKTH
mgnify:FL=1